MPKLITNDPGELVERRVWRGVRWLDEHAPFDWRRRLVDIIGGEATSRIYMTHDNEGVLSRAFEFDPSFANKYGYVTCASVMSRFDLSPKKAASMGFWWYDQLEGDANRLKQGWWKIITEKTSPAHGQHRHDQDFLQEMVDRKKSDTWLKKWNRCALFMKKRTRERLEERYGST